MNTSTTTSTYSGNSQPLNQDGFDAGTLIGTGGAKYGQASHDYERWGVLHKTCCDGPCAYHPLGATAYGKRPTLTTKVPPSFYAGKPQNASVQSLVKGASYNPPLMSFANQAGTGCAVVSGDSLSYAGKTSVPLSHVDSGYTGAAVPPPLAPIMPPFVALDSLGPSNTSVILGKTAQTNCDGCLVGASDLFEDQVPMYNAMKPFTAPVEGSLVSQEDRPPFLDSSGKPRQVVPQMAGNIHPIVAPNNKPSNQTIALAVIGILLLALLGWYLWEQNA